MAGIEDQPFRLKPMPTPIGNLTEGQALYLQHFEKGYTIQQTIKELLSKGRLVSFTQMYDLVEHLTKKDFTQNPAFKSYFEKLHAHMKIRQQGPPVGSIVTGLFKTEKPEDFLLKHPFFRSQSPMITAVFAKNAEVMNAPAGTMLCEAGQIERDLFFMIDGEAGIYKKNPDGGKRLLGFFGKDAIIGEVGFFMGELRTADVICTKPSKLVVVRYNPEAFEKLMNKDAAKSLSQRFRVVHALAKSQFLQSIPEEALDSLIYVGKTRQASEFEVLTKEGEKGDTCYIVINGSVVVTKGQKNIGVLGPGQAFGEIALFFTQGVRTATIMAQRDTTLLEIQAKDFYSILAGNLLLAREFEKLALERARKLSA